MTHRPENVTTIKVPKAVWNINTQRQHKGELYDTQFDCGVGMGSLDSPEGSSPARLVWNSSTPRNVNCPCIIHRKCEIVWYLRPAARIPDAAIG